MAKTKIERINSIEEQIAQLEAEKKKLLQQHKVQENKARTNRLCKRGGLLESMLPDTIPLTHEQFTTFLEKTVANDFGRRMLASIVAQNAATTVPQTAGAGAQGTTALADKTPQTAQQVSTGEDKDEGDGTRVSV